MKTVELFCGTKSFSKVAKEFGHETFTIDIDSQFNPDLCIDILNLKVSDLPKDVFILWASPPCDSFSVASISSNWIGGSCPKRVKAALGMAYVLKTLEIIKEIKPKYWFIENPRGMLRKMEFMQDFHRKTITYCQYGDDRMKPTDIWTNFERWETKPMCKNGDICHVSAPRGSRTGTQGLKDKIQRGVIPQLLFYEIFNQIKHETKEI